MVQSSSWRVARRRSRRHRSCARFPALLALPSELELGAVENIYLSPDEVPRDGPARVIVGSHGTARSRLSAGVSLNYLAVRLRAGESWRYAPAHDPTVGW